MAGVNSTLAATPFDGERTLIVVLDIVDAPARGPHALTLTLTSAGSRVDVGDHVGADVLISLAYNDAGAVVSGNSDSASLLRQGRVKVRGDVNALVDATAALQAILGTREAPAT